MELIIISLLLVVTALVYLFIQHCLSYWQRRGVPHLKPHFPLGNIQDWRKTKHFIDILKPIYDNFKGSGPFAGLYLMLKPVAVILDLDLVKHVLIKDFNKFDDRGVFHNEKDDPLSGNIFQTDGASWRPLRHKLTPTFTSGKMKFMFPTVLSVGVEFARVFEEKLKQQEIVSTDGAILEITDLLARFTADVIGSCAFGLDCNSLRDPNAEFATMGRRAFVDRRHGKLVDMCLDIFPELARRLHMRQLHPEVSDFYMRIVRDTIAYREHNKIKRNDFMNILIEMKNNAEENTKSLSLEQIAAQSYIFFLAGFETSSTTMGYALYELAQQPEIQDRLRQEVQEVLACSEGEFTYECMKKMPYMEMVISETLRKYPVLPHLMRKAKENYSTSDGRYQIDKDMIVIIPVYSIHHDPEFYPEPSKFDPERFTEEAIKARPSCSWLPFGEGPRNCIGLRFGKMQTYIGLTFMLQHFKFSVCEETQIPIEFGKKSILIAAENGIKLKVEKV